MQKENLNFKEEKGVLEERTSKINYWRFLSIILFFLLIIVIFFLLDCNSCKFFLSGEKQNENLEVTQESLESNSFHNQSALDKKQSLYELERLFLLAETKDQQATSYLFGVKINTFHPDWQCSNLMSGFTNTGFQFFCEQKLCRVDEVNFIEKSKSKDCLDEENNREYPKYILSSFEVSVEKELFNKDSGDQSTVFDPEIALESSEKTPRGIAYRFAKLETPKEEGCLKEYQVSFYSPKRLSKVHSEMTGTFYGSEIFYGKYLINFHYYDCDNLVDEAKLIKLTESFIDNIEFLEPTELVN